jgi:transcriptional regulator with XRE-family HTH domain
MDFAEKLQKLRANKGLTQRELSKMLKIASSTLGMYEIGKREPDFATLKRIAEIFNVTTDYLLGQSDSISTHLSPATQTTDISQEDLALLELARQLKKLPDSDQKEIESYIQYKKHLNKDDEQAAASGK